MAVMDPKTHPWLNVPASDYEGHMEATGQLGALRTAFKEIYANVRPRRLAVLGCGTGNGFEHVEPATTDSIVGVDINASYLEVARERFGTWGKRLELIQSDVLDAVLEPAGFDLVHVALLLEYVEPASLLRRVSGWIREGGICSIILQVPSDHHASVSPTGYDSLRPLAASMRLHDPDEINKLASRVDLIRSTSWFVDLSDGKQFSVAMFRRRSRG